MQNGANDSVLRHFNEGLITFAPTSKYLFGTNQYVRDRQPAWT
jgi:hypothetical protein